MTVRRRVFFVDPLFRALSSAVLRSQVFMQMKSLAELGCEVHFFGSDRPESITPEGVENIRQSYGMTSLTILPVPRLGESYRQIPFAIDAVLPVLIARLKECRPEYTFTWHIPVWRAVACIDSPLRGKLVFQCQGALSAEVRAKGGVLNGLKALYLQFQEKRCYRNAETLIAVSEQMSRWMQRFAGRGADAVLACCYDDSLFRINPERRLSLREKMGWPAEAPVVAYSGGASHWQRIRDIVALLGRAQKEVPELRVLILSRDVDLIRTLCLDSGLDWQKTLILSVPHEEVSDWLNMADVGIILRHDTLLNNVASPIKMAEYMACGLAVIATRGIGDYSAAIEAGSAGIILDDPSSQHSLKAIVDLLIDRNRLNRCRSNALQLARRFSWGEMKKVLADLYGL